MNSNEKIVIVNQVLPLIVSNLTQFEIQDNRLHISWVSHRGVLTKKAWQTIPKSDSFPSFHKEWSQGGTNCIALCHLARWIQNRKVLPLSVWSKWIANGLGGGMEGGQGHLILTILKDNEYPNEVNCIRCDRPIATKFDWYGFGKKSGCAHLKCPEIKQQKSFNYKDFIDKANGEQYDRLRCMYKKQAVVPTSDIPGTTIIVPPCNYYAIDKQSETFRTFFILDRACQYIWYVEENTGADYDWDQNNIRIPGVSTAKGWLSGYDRQVVVWVEELDSSMRSVLAIR